jgi:hypothetical protein
VGVVCVVVAPHTLEGLLVLSTGGGSTGSSSMFEIASKTLTDGDVDEVGGGGAGEEGRGFGFFFFFSFLYIKVGLIK